MIRVVIFLIFIGVLAFGAGWLMDRPGAVEIVWLDHRITTSVAVLVGAMALLTVVSIAVWSIVRSLWRAPSRIAHARHRRRAAKGHHAIVHGLIAVGAGDIKAAARHAADAKRLATEEPLALLLRAQSAQLAGDRQSAADIFAQMAGRKDTKHLGLHGLFVEARRRNDHGAASALAEEAAQSAPALAWAGQAVLETRSASGDWAGALDALERNRASGLVDKDTHRRQRAVLLTAQSQATAEGDRDAARAAALEAAKLAPDLVPAVSLASRFLSEAGEWRKAARMLEAAWRHHPHPDLAAAYMNLRPGDTARDRLARVQKLIRQSAAHIEGALALARAAIDAQAHHVARAALEPFSRTPTKRVALLMAELEQAENGDVGRAREWTARAVHAARDPAWSADGVASETWRAVSPVTGRLDSFEWKVPVAELTGPIIEAEPAEAQPVPAVIAASTPGAAPPTDVHPEKEPPTAPAPTVVEAATKAAADARGSSTVIPLVHAPDDPGPDYEADVEPTPKADGWPLSARLR